MKNKIFSKVVVFFLITCIALIYFKYKDNNMVSIANIPKLTFINKKVLKPIEASSTSIYGTAELPQLVSGDNVYWKSINDDILDRFKMSQCPDLETESSDTEKYTSINNVYDIAFLRNTENIDGPVSKKEKSKEEKLEYIARSSYPLSAEWSATTSLISKGILSITVNVMSDCGGVHPNDYIIGLNYLLIPSISNATTAKIINFKDIFIDYDKNKLEIQEIILKKVAKNLESNIYVESIDKEACYSEIEGLYNSSYDYDNVDNSKIYDPFTFSLFKDGINILSFGLTYAAHICEPSELTVKYSDLEPYISPNFKQLLK